MILGLPAASGGGSWRVEKFSTVALPETGHDKHYEPTRCLSHTSLHCSCNKGGRFPHPSTSGVL